MTEWMMYRFPSQGGPGSTRPKTGLAEPASASDFTTHDALGRVISSDRVPGASLTTPPVPQMDLTRGSMSSVSTQSTREEVVDPASKVFNLRHGRRYLREGSYPLPCDLPELQRQNLHTTLAVKVFGKPICAPHLEKEPPATVLEIGCGSGYWSSICHDYLSSLGHTDVAFTGLDIVPLAPDFSKHGMNWRFVQHDLRRVPIPFNDAEFDLVMLKDLSLAIPLGQPSQRMLDECCRVLKPGGTLEIWETDHIIRSLLPNPPPTPSTRQEDNERGQATATFLISPGTPFATAQNRFLQDSNNWINEALERRKLPPVPCTRVAQIILQEPDVLSELDYRRIAIPLNELRWEREAHAEKVAPKRREGEMARPRTAKNSDLSSLSEEQASLRYTALLIVVQFIESLEPILKDVSGKNAEEWQRWWAWMMSDLLENRNASSGECLEMGAWWARKVEKP